MVQLGEAELVLHRDNRFLEPALIPRLLGALLALHCIGVHVIARIAVLGRDQVRRDALRHEIMVERHLRVDNHRAAIRTHGHAAHGFHAAANGHVGLAGHDFRRSKVHRFKAGGAETVYLKARRGLGVVGIQRRRTGDVRALLAYRRDAAQDHIVDHAGIEIIAVADGLELLGGQLQRGDLVQRAILLALAARGARSVVNICVGHGGSPLGVF